MNVTPQAYESIIKNNKSRRIYIRFMACKVKEFLKITRCFKCQILRHNAANCKAEFEACGWCAELGHIKKDCPNRDSAAVGGIE